LHRGSLCQDIDGSKGHGLSIACHEGSSPRMEIGFGKPVLTAKAAHGPSALLPVLNGLPPEAFLLGAAGFACRHDVSLLCEGLHHASQERRSPDAHPMSTRN
jgi:hypothetical protein